MELIAEAMCMIDEKTQEVNPHIASLAEVQRTLAEYVHEPETLRMDERKNMALVLQLISKEGSWIKTFEPDKPLSIFQLVQENDEMEYRVTFCMLRAFSVKNETFAIEELSEELDRAKATVDCFPQMMNALEQSHDISLATDNVYDHDFRALDHAYRMFFGKLKSNLERSFSALTTFSYRLLNEESKQCEHSSVISALYGFEEDQGIVFNFVGNQEYVSNPARIESTKSVVLDLLDSDDTEEIDRITEMKDYDEYIKANSIRFSQTHEKYEKVKKSLPGGACTVLMTLAFNVMLQNGFNTFNLHNCGGIAGCKCYVAAGDSNALYAFKMDEGNHRVFDEIKSGSYSGKKLIRYVEDDCLPEKSSPKLIFISPYLLFNYIHFMDVRSRLNELQNKLPTLKRGELELELDDIVSTLEATDQPTTKKQRKMAKQYSRARKAK